MLLCEASLESRIHAEHKRPPVGGTPNPSPWLAHYAVSRLLAEPHYLTPLEPPNAIGDAKANRLYELILGIAEDCFLGTRLVIYDRTGQTRTTDPKRIELAKQVFARALKLAPENEAYRKLVLEIGT